jgi:hypothetical protein
MRRCDALNGDREDLLNHWNVPKASLRPSGSAQSNLQRGPSGTPGAALNSATLNRASGRVGTDIDADLFRLYAHVRACNELFERSREDASAPDWNATANSGAILETAAPAVVPEPPSITFVGLGILGIVAGLKRKSRALNL